MRPHSPIPGPKGSVAEAIHWRCAETDPPDESIVLVYAPARADSPVCSGYRERGVWYDVDGYDYKPGQVKGWADMPKGAAP